MFITIGLNNVVAGDPVIASLFLTSAKMYKLGSREETFSIPNILVGGCIRTQWKVINYNGHIGYEFVADIFTELGEGKAVYLITEEDLLRPKIVCPELN